MAKNTNDAHNPNKKEIGRKKKRLIEARKKGWYYNRHNKTG